MVTAKPNCRRRRRNQRGFTLIELMIALTVLLIGVSGILSLQLVSFQSTAYSRHATEAAVLGEDKMEQLRTVPVSTLAPGSEQVNALGIPDTNGLYNRSWTISWNGNVGTLIVTVTWNEEGLQPYTTTYRTQLMQ
jgi:prepilin-type N-terminal cleavage/methylation domain-containing protein